MIKKLLIILLVVFTNTAIKAQTNCSAAFGFTINGLTVKFTTTNLLSSSQHTWSFGDGSISNIDTPTHTYAVAGTYVVKHKVFVYNGAVNYCADSSMQTITLGTSNPCNLQANFSFIKDSINRKKVYFTNTSFGFLSTDSIRWNFGDGSPFEYTNNPTHTYANLGTYNVCIRVKRPTIATTVPCVSEICKTIIIDTIFTANCNAAFTKTVTGLTVTVLPVQTTSVQHQWNFGNGFTSSLIAPTHTYATAGTYVIKHKVTQYGNSNTPICTDSTMQTVTVQALPLCNMQAYYTFTKDSINRKKIYFTNASVNYTSTDTIRWSFGDGTFSNNQNPTHTYTNVGMYTVCIRIARPMGIGTPTCIKEYCNIVIVDSTPLPVVCNANFASTTSNNVVSFVAAMPNATHTWSFGDGTTGNIANPIHTYVNGGVYTVKHKVSLIGLNGQLLCKDSVVKTITIAQPCNLQASFIYSRDTINKKKIYFSNTSVGFLLTDSIRWNFGDGTPVSYTANPIHTYANYGVYNVCIRVKRNTTTATGILCVSEICKTVIVDSNGVVTTVCPYTVNFTMRRDSINFKKVYFTNTSTNVSGAIATWYFGDGTSATGWNAVHEYSTNALVFQPCLKVTYSNTCSKMECKVLQLPNNNVCTLQPYPNPASSVVNGTVHLTQPMVIYTRIYNQSNIIVRQAQQNGVVGANTITVNVATLPFGLYRMDVQYGTQICRALFMKQ